MSGAGSHHSRGQMMRSIVAFYEVDRTYGGPEERGVVV